MDATSAVLTVVFVDLKLFSTHFCHIALTPVATIFNWSSPASCCFDFVCSTGDLSSLFITVNMQTRSCNYPSVFSHCSEEKEQMAGLVLSIPVCPAAAPTMLLCDLCAPATGLSCIVPGSSFPLYLFTMSRPCLLIQVWILSAPLYIWLQQSCSLDYWYISGQHRTVTSVQADTGLFLFILYLEGLEHYTVHCIVLC